MQMTQEDLDLLQKTLRSGEIKQTIGHLHLLPLNKGGWDRMCCLGVVSHLFGPRIGVVTNVDYENAISYDGTCSVLPDKLQGYFRTNLNGAKIPERFLNEQERAKCRPSEEGISIMALNDHGVSFLRIAELLPYGVTIIDNYTDRNVVRDPTCK
jgi:hypothetical protein